jgi:alkylation response protein AidB-like acyl-CoA dehydrogenase
MHAAGWVGITWPKEYGGRDAGLIERVIWDEEYTAARAPVLPGNMGLSLVGPTIIHWGTDAQKRRQLRGEPPGPEGSVLKLSGSELGVRIADAAGELLGMHVLVNLSSPTVPDAPRWFNRVLAARQYTISAGTSEIQRNIIGERVLGLPRA